MQGIIDLVQKLGPQRLAAMGAVTLFLIGFFAFVLLRVSQPPMGTLFTDITPQESAAIVKELETRGIRYEMRGDGTAVMVPKEMIAKVRMELAAKGMPAGGGGVGYEIFDKGDSFSATSFVQNVNHLRALEGELSRTIRSLGQVQTARVHLAIPERRLFQKDKAEPRASIVLKVRGELDMAQVRAIRHLVASAVEGLKANRISIVDETGRLLADGAGEESDTGAAFADRQATQERRIKAQVEDIVASVVGRGRARVQVTADMDQTRVQQTSESFDPESRVVRSTQTKSESNTSNEGKDGQVTVGNELPGAAKPEGQGTREQGQKSDETVNYEISRTTRTETIEGGRLKKLSVAVLVDGVYTRGANGETTYAPRSADELTRIATLVRMGVGFDKARGDQLEVINLRFAETPPEAEAREPTLTEKYLNFSREDLMRLAEMIVFGLLTLIVMIFVVRPLVRQIMEPSATPVPASPPEYLQSSALGQQTLGQQTLGQQTLGQQTLGQQTLANPGTQALPAGTLSIERLGEQIASQPHEAAAILKSWIRSAA